MFWLVGDILAWTKSTVKATSWDGPSTACLVPFYRLGMERWRQNKLVTMSLTSLETHRPLIGGLPMSTTARVKTSWARHQCLVRCPFTLNDGASLVHPSISATVPCQIWRLGFLVEGSNPQTTNPNCAFGSEMLPSNMPLSARYAVEAGKDLLVCG